MTTNFQTHIFIHRGRWITDKRIQINIFQSTDYYGDECKLCWMVEWERRINVVILVWIDTNSLSPVEAWPKPTPTWIIILLTTTTTQLSPEHFIQELGELYSLHSEREIENCRISVSSGDFRNVYELIVKYNCFISSSCKKIQLTQRRRGIFLNKERSY